MRHFSLKAACLLVRKWKKNKNNNNNKKKRNFSFSRMSKMIGANANYFDSRVCLKNFRATPIPFSKRVLNQAVITRLDNITIELYGEWRMPQFIYLRL